MSLQNFANNVMTLALENCLISDIPNGLTPDTVIDMSDLVVGSLGPESELTTKQRDESRIRLQTLQHSLAVCQEHCKEYRKEITQGQPMNKSLPSAFVSVRTRTNTARSQNRRAGF